MGVSIYRTPIAVMKTAVELPDKCRKCRVFGPVCTSMENTGPRVNRTSNIKFLTCSVVKGPPYLDLSLAKSNVEEM